jgi:hypothetical protein
VAAELQSLLAVGGDVGAIERLAGAVEAALPSPAAAGPPPPLAETAARGLEVAATLDAGAHFAAVALGARMALSLYDSHQDWAVGIGDLEVDQGRDAAYRALGLGLVALFLFEGSPEDRAAALLSTRAGQRLSRWLAGVEVALALHTDDEPLSDHALSALVDLHADSLAMAATRCR